MNPKQLSIISTLSNLGLTILKLIVGLFSHSIALIAEALHSGLDIASSLITYLGISASEKPADKEHRYGHGGYEGVASFVVSLLLFLSAIWILFEAVSNLISGQHEVHFTIWGIVLMAASVVINEALARLKFKSSTEFSSLALASDAEHSRADVLSSVAVLIGLLLVKYFTLADSVLAALVALYIFYEAYSLSREAIDSLVDKADPELEEKLKEYLSRQSINYSDLKTRKIGSSSFAEIDLIFDPRVKADEITRLAKSLEQQLLVSFPELKQVSLTIESHDFSESVTRSQFGGKFRSHRRFEKLGPAKSVLPGGHQTKRIIVPLQDSNNAPDFGAAEYLVIDLDGQGKIVQKTTVVNKFYEPNSVGHGMKFAKSVSADKVIVKKIGQQAKNNLVQLGIEVEKIPADKKLEDLRYA